MRKTFGWSLVALLCLGVVAGGCKKKIKNQATEEGLPCWLTEPSCECEANEFVGIGTSELAAVDMSAAKTDAQTMATNEIARQLNQEVNNLVERSVTAMRDLGAGDVYGQKTLKDINENFILMEIRGARFTDYYYVPTVTNAQTVHVRARLSVDSNALADEVLASLASEIRGEELEIAHEKAIMRLEKVREEYLDRTGD